MSKSSAQRQLIETLVLLPLFSSILAVSASAQVRTLHTHNQSSAGQSSLIAQDLRSVFGSVVEPVTAFKPYYLIGDFNGDGAEDLLIVVRVKEKRTALPKDVRVVNPFDLDAKVAFPDNPASEKKLALAIIHSWKIPQPTGKFLLIGASPILILENNRATSGRPEDAKNLIELMTRRGKRRRGQKFPRSARGDVILLGTEVGGDSTLYWNGGTYRWEDAEDD